MWTPIVLMCSMYVTTECATYGGPIFKTEAACYQGMEDVGLPYLRQKFPSHIARAKKCVNWDIKDKIDT